MAEQKNRESDNSAAAEKIPTGQRIFDNVWLLLILSLLISGVLYNLWGLIEVLGAPPLTQ